MKPKIQIISITPSQRELMNDLWKMSQELVLKELSKYDWVDYETLSKKLNYNIKTLNIIINRLHKHNLIIKEKKIAPNRKRGTIPHRVYFKINKVE